MPHVHYFAGKTSLYVGHEHQYAEVTGPELQQSESHTHRFRVAVTEEQTDHLHLIVIETGTEVTTSLGHTHMFYGSTTVSGIPPHAHYFGGFTGPPKFL